MRPPSARVASAARSLDARADPSRLARAKSARPSAARISPDGQGAALPLAH
jgi:hypothetical protein